MINFVYETLHFLIDYINPGNNICMFLFQMFMHFFGRQAEMWLALLFNPWDKASRNVIGFMWFNPWIRQVAYVFINV